MAERSSSNDGRPERARSEEPKAPFLRSIVGRGLVIAALALAIAIGIWSNCRGRSEGLPHSTVAGPETRGSARPTEAHRTGPTAGPVEQGLAARDAQDPDRGSLEFKNRMQQALDDYLAWARYPPGSRPMEEHADWIEPHRVQSSLRPVDFASPGSARLRAGQDRLYVVPGDKAVITLEAFDGETRVPVDASAAEIATDDGGRGERLATIELKDDGVAPDEASGDAIQSGRFEVPAQLTDYRGDLVATARVRVGSERGQVAWRFVCTGSPPARFTGVVREALEEGSLALYVGIELERPGQYEIIGRLYDSHDKPFGFLKFNGTLDVAAASVRLVAFGKLVSDAGATTPFVLKDIEGWRLVPGSSPDREIMRMFEGSYRTKPYPPESFSSEEWSSPEKEHEVRHLERQITEGP